MPTTPLTVLRPLSLAHCDTCSLCPPGQLRATSYVYGKGPRDAPLIVVGEAPGATELEYGVPFRGPSGQLLWKTLRGTSDPRQPERVYATNAVLCLPTGSATSKQMKACHDRLFAELDELTGKRVILLAGAKAAEAVTGRKCAMGRMNGRHEWSERFGAWLVYAYHPAAVLRHAEWFVDFKRAIGVALEALTWAPGPKPATDVITYDLVDSPYRLSLMLANLALRREIACDIETTGLDYTVDRVLEVGFAADEHHAYIVSAELLEQAGPYYAVKALLESAEHTWVYHNGKFDTNFLRSALGIEARIGADTLLLHHALDERGGGAEGGHHDLKSLATRYCGAPHYSEAVDAAHMADVPPATRHAYQASDLCYTQRLYSILRAELAKEPPSRAGYPTPLECHDRFLVPVANAIAAAELRGIRVDPVRWDGLCDEYGRRSAETLHRLRQYVENDEFNPRSPAQVATVLAGLGYPSVGGTSKSALHELQALDREAGRPEEPLLRDLLEYRSLEAIKRTYLVGIGRRLFSRMTGWHDTEFRLHTHLLMHGTGTGRLASRDPNLQNIPKDSPIREMFVPSDGYTFVEADYAQLEVRVLAWMSGDPELAATVREDDVHWATAARVWPALTAAMTAARGDLAALTLLCRGHAMFQDFYVRQISVARTESADELHGWMVTRIRRQAKYVTFGIMYGEGAESLSHGEKGLGVSKREAQAYIDTWAETYAIAWSYLRDQAHYAETDRWVESPNGRRRRFGYPRELGVSVATEAMNFPIQSYASDINLAALTRLSKSLASEELGFALLPVHDSILFEVRSDRLDAAERCIVDVMTHIVDSDQVAFPVDVKAGQSWASLH